MELAEALSRVIPFAVSKKEDRPVLNCIRFAQGDGKLTLIASDAYRLAEVTLDFEDGEAEALIPADELKGLVSALKKAHRVRLSFEPNGDSHSNLIIETEAIRYQWRSESGNFPDYQEVIPTEFKAEARFDTREMMRAGMSLTALSLDKASAITLTMKEGLLALTATDDVGQAQIEAEVEGEVETAISGGFLTQALKALGGMAEVKVSDTKAPILFTVDGYRLAVMPVVLPSQSKVETEAEAVASEAEAQVETETETKAETKADKPKRKSRKVKEPVAV
jgi:DNA polymerase III sliding clamp (beta) subunit (PCNA family)